jgi:hypothetical protein
MTVSLLAITMVVLALAAGLCLSRAVRGIRAYFKFRGQRLVTCPETQQAAAVAVGARKAALVAFLKAPRLRLVECSRWPERENCGQACLKQIEVDPEHCLVWNLVAQWYEGKRCVYCRKPIGPLHHLDHAPALLGPDSTTTEWKQARPERLPEIFQTHRPVCWNCHVTETFRRLHPELVTERPYESRRIM